MVQQPQVGQSLLITEASRSHSINWRSAGLLWTSDQPYAETSTWQHTILHKRQAAMLSVELETAIPRSEMSQTYALDRTATVMGCGYLSYTKMKPITLFYVTYIPYKLTNLYTHVKI